MEKGVLALTENGEVTWCRALPEDRGKRRCKHIFHQQPGQTDEEFLESIEPFIRVDEAQQMPDLYENTKELVTNFGIVEDPNWGKVINSIPNPFHIGSKDEEKGTYEEAKLENLVLEDIIVSGDGEYYKITGKYVFRGREFDCDFGMVPKVDELGSITMNGVQWRVLPVLEARKSGVVSYSNSIVLRNEDGHNVSLSMSKDPDSDVCKIRGVNVPIDVVERYLSSNGTDIDECLSSAQIYSLKQIDPVVFERFPQLKEIGGLRSLKNLKEDEPNDIEWRKCLKYEDFVKYTMEAQMRRMGRTFRDNLSRRTTAAEKESLDGQKIDPLDPKFDEKMPLFYQVNMTENIKSDLVGRSNVQHVDDLNPITALSQSQKISLTGPGGFNKDSAPHNLRMPHDSHEGIIDSSDVSSGKNVGFTMTLSNGYIDDRGFIRKKEQNSKHLAPSDFTPFKNHDDPNRGIMAVAHMKQACPILGGEDPTPLGDPVSDAAWKKISGSKLGCELRIAYIPDSGVFEDAVYISQSAANKMATVQSHTYKPHEGMVLSPKYKIGDRVERKEILAGEEIKTGGVITEINKDGSFVIETTYAMTPGDKLAGRHGNKSVVSKVLPDDQMPKMLNEQTNEYEPVQIVMSPLSVAGRKNLGQVMEANQLAGDGPTINKKRTVITSDGHKIEATGGKSFIMRLNHIAEKKLASHSDNFGSNRESEGQRIGEMDAILLSLSDDRLAVLDYLRHQEAYDAHNKLHSLLKSIGVDVDGVNW